MWTSDHILAADSLPPMMLAGTAAAAAAVGGLAWAVLSIMGARWAAPGDSFEAERRRRLREGSGLYRAFEPLIDDLAGMDRTTGEADEQLARRLAVSDQKLPWKPAEFRAAARLTAVMIGAGAAVFFGLMLSPVSGAALGVMLGYFYANKAVMQVGSAALDRVGMIKRRLPYAVDMLALLMEAGSGFAESLQTVVRESAGHPLAEEFGRVLREIAMGRTRRDALEALSKRLSDEMVSELVFAVVKGEELGTPLAQILRSQADQMRLKRSQMLEKAAGEAQVKIVFPGMIIMIACLLIVVAPFILSAISSSS